jgi:hypothetical protein
VKSPEKPPATGNAELDAFLQRQRVFLEELRAGALAVLEPEVHLLTGAGTILPSWDVVVYTGPGSETVVLPSAQRIPGRRSRRLVVMNVGPGTLTLAAQGGELVDNAATITAATGVKATLDADGATRWES